MGTNNRKTNEGYQGRHIRTPSIISVIYERGLVGLVGPANRLAFTFVSFRPYRPTAVQPPGKMEERRSNSLLPYLVKPLDRNSRDLAMRYSIPSLCVCTVAFF